VSGVLEEVARWAPGDQAQQAAVVELALARVRAQVERGSSWPAPGVLRRKVHAAALLLDLTAVEKRKKDAVERRGVFTVLTGAGEASLSITGPDFRVGRMMDAIRARAHALGRLPGDTRTLEQRMFDAADELLGSTADIPSTDEAGDPVPVSPRPTELQVLVPYSVLAGGDLELAELPGLGPILPSTARELLAEATSVRRVAIDTDTGHVLAVDDRNPAAPHRQGGAGPAGEHAGAAAGPEQRRLPHPRSGGAVRPRPRPGLPVPRLHHPRPMDRPRPSRALAPRTHRHPEPALPLSSSSPRQASRLHRHPRPRRQHRLDHPRRPPVPQPPTHLLTQPSRLSHPEPAGTGTQACLKAARQLARVR